MEHIPVRISAWERMRNEAEKAMSDDPMLGSFYKTSLIDCPSFEYALSLRLARKLAGPDIGFDLIFAHYLDVYAKADHIVKAAKLDAIATLDRDPASHRLMEPLLFFKGYQLCKRIVLRIIIG